MREIRETEVFRQWLRALKDSKASEIIRRRILLMAAGSLGDVKSLGDSVFEARIHFGSGYRLYFAQNGSKIIVLICGGSKRTQRRDIITAKKMVEDLDMKL